MAHYDMLVIGSGPAGQKAAIQAAKVGKKVAIMEQQESCRRHLHQLRHDPEQILARSGDVPFRIPTAQPLRRQLPGQKRYHFRGPRPTLRPCHQSRAGNDSKPIDPQLGRLYRRHRLRSSIRTGSRSNRIAKLKNTPRTTSSSLSAPCRRTPRISPSTARRSSTATACYRSSSCRNH